MNETTSALIAAIGGPGGAALAAIAVVYMFLHHARSSNATNADLLRAHLDLIRDLFSKALECKKAGDD